MKQILQKLQAELDARGHGACVDNNSRMIVHDDRNIYLYLKESGMTEYVSYTPELYYLLASPRFCSFSYKYEMGRAMVELMPYYKSGRRYKRHLGTVLLQWYKHGNTAEQFINAYPTLDKAKLTADHINSDIHNHCVWNMDEVPTTANSQKSDLAARIKPPYFCYAAITPERIYRVCFGYRTDFFHGQELYLSCDDNELFTDCLRKIMAMKDAAAWVRRYGTPAQVYQKDRKGFFASETFMRADRFAERLLSMEPTAFERWTDTSSIIGCRKQLK